jgi:hypothetical protein
MGLRPTQGDEKRLLSRNRSAIRAAGTPGTLCRKTFPRKVRGTADPSAALGMTKGRVVALHQERRPVENRGSLHYARSKNISKKGPRNCRSASAGSGQALGCPGFPVELGGVSELHAAFFKESRTRGYLWCRVVGNPGPLPRHAGAGGMTKGRAALQVLLPFSALACVTEIQGNHSGGGLT